LTCSTQCRFNRIAGSREGEKLSPVYSRGYVVERRHRTVLRHMRLALAPYLSMRTAIDYVEYGNAPISTWLRGSLARSRNTPTRPTSFVET
jgi:hypothetical protein